MDQPVDDSADGGKDWHDLVQPCRLIVIGENGQFVELLQHVRREEYQIIPQSDDPLDHIQKAVPLRGQIH